MTATDYATLAVAVTVIVSAFAGAVRWLVKHYLAELKPNGGSSMRDSVNTNSERLERLETRVDKIYELLCESKAK
jgi:uncharacterized protein YciW